MFEFANKRHPQCHYFICFHHNYSCNYFCSHEGWSNGWHVHKSFLTEELLNMIVSSALCFCTISSSNGCGQGKGTGKNQTHSNISLDLHPQIEKAPECPHSPHEVQHIPVTSHQPPPAAPEAWEGALSRGGHRLQPSFPTAQPEYFIFISLSPPLQWQL